MQISHDDGEKRMTETHIPKYKISVPITSDELTLSVRGDFHYGIEGISGDEMYRVLCREQDQHRDNQFTIYTGDLIENNLNNSVGHGYDIAIRDPAKQKNDMIKLLTRVNQNLYGKDFDNKFKKVGGYYTNVLSAGVPGNHEYRTRKTSGQWLHQELYNPSKILDLGMNAIIELKIFNKKIKESRTVSIFVSHRPVNSSGNTIESILRGCKKKKGDILADIYTYGHYHRRLILPDGAYDRNGKFKKILYVINPSPMEYAEYADWSGYSPLSANWYVNVRIPLDPSLHAYGKI